MSAAVLMTRAALLASTLNRKGEKLMRKHDTPNRSKGSTKDDLTSYEARASNIINLMFDGDTPSFVISLLRSWLTELENETQIFYNVREVAEVALPLMLRRADELGLDPENAESRFTRGVVQCLEGYLDINGERAETIDEPERNTIADKRHAEWRTVAAHYAEVLFNADTPRPLRDALADMLVETMNQASVSVVDPELLPITYPLAMQRLAERKGE